MNYFKNLTQLESKYHLFGKGDTCFEVVFNSNHKKAIKEFKNIFNSLNFQETITEKGLPILVSEPIPNLLFSAFGKYMQEISNYNRRCLSFSSYSPEQLSQLFFKDYVEHFNSCFLIAFKDSQDMQHDDEDDYYLHKQNLFRKYAIGNQIFNSHIASESYPQELYANLSKELCKYYNTDFLVEKKTRDLNTVVGLSRIGKDNLDQIIFDITCLLMPILEQSAHTMSIYGYPEDMLKHYIKDFNHHSNYVIADRLIGHYISKRYSIANGFCPKDENSQIQYKNIKDFAILDEISKRRCFGVSYISNFVIQEEQSHDNDYPSYDIFEEFIASIVGYIWSGLSLHYTLKHIKHAYALALKENKSLLVLSKEKAPINKPLARSETIKFLMQSLNIEKEQLPSDLWEQINESLGDNSDIHEEDNDITNEEAEAEIKNLDD